MDRVARRLAEYPWPYASQDPVALEAIAQRVAAIGAREGLLTYSEVVSEIDFHLPSVHGGASLRLEDRAPVAWGEDGRTLYVLEPGQRIPARVFTLDVTTGKLTPWKELAPADLTGASAPTRIRITPDGRAHAYTMPRVLSDLYVVTGVR